MMKMLLAAASVAFVCAPALAQTPEQPKPDHPKPAAAEKFAKHDADKNGVLSLTEVQAMDMKATQADFDKYDADKNKALSAAEFAKWVEAKTTAPASAPG